MEWKTEMEAACSALGTFDGSKYYKEDDCLEGIKDLIRYLRRDDDNFTLRRGLGQIGVIKSDLIPLIRDYSEDPELFDMALRLMVNLTSPEILLFREEMPEDKTMRNYYLELQSHRQAYKRAFIDPQLWVVLSGNLGKLLRKDFDERSEDDRMVIERILILARNILQVPRDAAKENRTDGDVSIHDQILWVLHKSGMEDLLLYIASSDDESQYCLHVLEIISLMFREQDPKHLATANFQRSKDEKVEDDLTLIKARNEENEKKRQKMVQMTSMRHSRFGGTFTVLNVKSISERSLIYHKPLSSTNQINFDKEKRPKKISKNRLMPDDCDTKRRSTLSIRLFLKEFCIEFLNAAYNKLMFIVKDYLNRKKAQQNDETYYLWAMKFFMEFNRVHKFRVELVTETLSKATFHYIHQQIEHYRDNYEHEKKNRPMCLVWGRRMHLGIRAYQELLFNLVFMSNSESASVRESAVVLRADVFYEPEYRELCLQQFGIYQSDKMSINYLRDLVETTHVFLKLMESMSKNKHIMISKKGKKKKTKAVPKNKSKGNGAHGFPQGSREANEQIWNDLSSNLSRSLQDSAEDLPTVTPFDAALDVPIDEQKAGAVFKIQDCLKNRRPSEAVALLRASREVWPENDAFGASDADAEDEFMALREILFANIPKPQYLRTDEQEPEEEIEEEEEVEDEEGNEEEFVTYSVEQEFDFRYFVMKFATKNVCNAYGILFSNYAKNSDHTNLCIVKMFHRIAFDLSLPAMLFHVSVFRTFQSIYKDFCLAPTNSTLRELTKFAKFLLRKFYDLCPQNKHIFMELCFWKTTREASEVVDGYGTQASTNKEKSSYWSEEDEEKLARVFRQLIEMEEGKEKSEGNRTDLLDEITLFFVESNKSRRQVARKLKEMALISDIREVTKKPLKLKAPREWAQSEIDELRGLYGELKDAVDPLNRILDRLTVKRPKKRVVEKIMELGLCDDKKKLMKKKLRRGLKEGDPGYLQQASETDSALEDSSSGSDESADESESSEEDSGDQIPELVKAIKDLLDNGDEFKHPLKWLQASLVEEADDRNEANSDDEDENTGVAILPLEEDCVQAMEKEKFLNVLKLLEIMPPGNEQEQYWRIPGSLTAASLRTKSVFLERVLNGSYDLDDLDLRHLGCAKAPTSGQKARRKKKEKRGPNKWMPMRREVDSEALARIEQLFPSKPKQESNKKSKTKAKSEKVGKKTPTSRRKLKTFLSEDSDDESKKPEEAVSDETSEDEAKSQAILKQSALKFRRSFLNSSSEDEAPIPPRSPGNKKNNEEANRRVDSGSESDISPKKVSSSTKKIFVRDSSDDDSDSKSRTITNGNDQISDTDKAINPTSREFLSSDDSDTDKEVDKSGSGRSRSVSRSSSIRFVSRTLNSSKISIRSRSSSISSRSRSSSPKSSSVLDTPSSRVAQSSNRNTPGTLMKNSSQTPKRGRRSSSSGSDDTPRKEKQATLAVKNKRARRLLSSDSE